MKKPLAVTAALVAALALPAAASASYTISRAEAQLNTRDIVRTLYSDYGVTYDNAVARCRPQGARYDSRYTYHRWVCGWAAGPDSDGDYPGGVIRITGHSNATYGYIVLKGLNY